MNSSPFDYPQEISHLLDQVEEDLTDDNEIALGEIQLEVRSKMLGVGMLVKEMSTRREGLKTLKKEVDGRIKTLDSNEKRLKQWIWKQAKDMEIIKKDAKGEWKGEKIQSNQITISWRKSKGVKTHEDNPEFKKLPDNFPELFHFKVKPLSKDGGLALNQLVQAGMLQIESSELSKSSAKEALVNKVGIAGLELEHRINPQIKV